MLKKDKYQFIIKLAPAIGDWTRIKLPRRDIEEISITQIKDFGFDRISQSDLKEALFYHYYFAQDLAESASKDLNIKTFLHSITARQISFSEFIQIIEPKILRIDFCHPEWGIFNIFLSYSFAEAIINRIFGGKGQVVGKMNFTEIEKTALKVFFERVKDVFFKLWPVIKDKDKAGIEIGEIEDVVDISISDKESYISFGVQLALGEGKTEEVIIGYGQDIFKQLLRRKRTNPQRKQRRIYLNEGTLSRIKVPVVIGIGATKISMSDLQKLQKGDVVKLETPINDPVSVVVGDKVNFLGQPGIADEKLAVQLILPEVKKVRKLEKAVIVEKEAPPVAVEEKAKLKGEEAFEEEKIEEEFAEGLEEVEEKEGVGEEMFEEEVAAEEEEEVEEEEEEDLFDDEDFSWDDIDDSEEF